MVGDLPVSKALDSSGLRFSSVSKALDSSGWAIFKALDSSGWGILPVSKALDSSGLVVLSTPTYLATHYLSKLVA